MAVGTTLLLSSALLHALWNAFVRRAADKESAPLAMVTVCLVAGGACALVRDHGAFLPPRALVWAVVAGLAEGGYLVALGRAMRDAPLGLAYAVSRGGAMLLVWPVSILLLDERMSAAALGGAVALGVGLVVAAWPSTTGRDAPLRARLSWSWATAVFIAGYHLAYGRALASGARPATLFVVSIAFGIVSAYGLLGRGRRGAPLRALFRQPLLLGAGGVLAALSFLLFLEGLARSGAGAALSLRNTSIAFTIVLSAMMGERASARQWIGVASIAAGAMLVG